MSSMGKTVDSNLPEDIEERLTSVQEKISFLEREKITLESDVANKKGEQTTLNIQISEARLDYENIVNNGKKILEDLKNREERIVQKESAMDVYTNALKAKEEKILKYLAILENMKEIISK
jgi:chromosome segregation ATPase